MGRSGEVSPAGSQDGGGGSRGARTPALRSERFGARWIPPVSLYAGFHQPPDKYGHNKTSLSSLWDLRGAQPMQQVLLRPSASPPAPPRPWDGDTFPHRNAGSWERGYREPPKSQSLHKSQKKWVPGEANNKTVKALPRPCWAPPPPRSSSAPLRSARWGFFLLLQTPRAQRRSMGHQCGRLTCPEGIVLHPLCGSQCYSPAWPGHPSSSSASPACRSFAAAPLGTPAHPSLQAHKEQARHGHELGAAVWDRENPPPSPWLQPKAAHSPALPAPPMGSVLYGLSRDPAVPDIPPFLALPTAPQPPCPAQAWVNLCPGQTQPGCCSSPEPPVLAPMDPASSPASLGINP